ncbi:MAG: hypothetical protein J6L89_05230 [Clostridia bacterium]|nr:hypothetical protein [Clostridia bacterium]
MKIINTCDKIKTTFVNGFDIDLWRKYASEISKELPLKCENDAKEYDFEKDVLPVLKNALNEEKIDFVSRNFQAVVDTLNANLTKLFDKEPDINIILYLGLCNGAGWATTLDGKDTVLLGIEKITELDWGDETNMRALILHEIGHLWHKMYGNLHIPEYTKRRKGIAQLYCEGVAMVCEHILCGDNEFYHQDKDGWLSWCYENENDIKKEYLRRLDEKTSVQDFFGDWCSYNGHSDVGYFLGCRFIEHLMKSHSLKEIAKMKYMFLNKAFTEYAKMPDIIFEYLNKNDFPDVSSVVFDILADNMEKIAPTGNSREDDFNCWYDGVSDGLKRDERQIILIKDSECIIGFFQYYTNTDTFMMEEIQLKHEYQGKSVFRSLYGFLLENINDSIKFVEAYANKGNLKSIGILEHLGLIRIGMNKNGNSFHFRGDYSDLVNWYKSE